MECKSVRNRQTITSHTDVLWKTQCERYFAQKHGWKIAGGKRTARGRDSVERWLQKDEFAYHSNANATGYLPGKATVG